MEPITTELRTLADNFAKDILSLPLNALLFELAKEAARIQRERDAQVCVELGGNVYAAAIREKG